uniref:Uncharacterized protein n=1 Tax=Arundo donax TaxID=35708 RepID=A0A0A9HAL4_ARUDO
MYQETYITRNLI